VLIVFGGFVLLRFSDRPGGEFEFHGMKIHSVGAGLPLIVLGVVAVVLAVFQGAPDEAATVVAATPSATTSTVEAQSPTGAPIDIGETGSGRSRHIPTSVLIRQILTRAMDEHDASVFAVGQVEKIARRVFGELA